MLLTKDGITVDVSHPVDIAQYKHIGYVEVIAEVELEDKPVKPVTVGGGKSKKTGKVKADDEETDGDV